MRPVQLALLALFAASAFGWSSGGDEQEDQESQKKMFSSMICDVLVEDVYRELEKDVFKVQEAQQRKLGGASKTMHVDVKMGADYTVDRMLNPTHDSPGCAFWETYTPGTRKVLRLELSRSHNVIKNMWKGVPIKTARSHVYRLKNKVCTGAHETVPRAAPWGKKTVAAHYRPRYPPFADSECGRCLEVMRDIAIAWLRTAKYDSSKRDRALAWTTVEQVCEDVELRHDVPVRDDIRAFCEEVASEEYMQDMGLLQVLMGMDELKLRSDRVQTPLMLSGYLAKRICEAKAQLCTSQDVVSEVQKFPQMTQEMYAAGVKAAGQKEGPSTFTPNREGKSEL